ncbi:hypothetical protein CMT52_08945 [Elizabethkingia anophelis]|nr:hypothetical protein [Elizabethkingia anophelis]MDV4024460.1 hypothetical protein [Elizabethkingia anophelis]
MKAFNSTHYQNSHLIYFLDEVKKTFIQYQLHSTEFKPLPKLIRIEKNNGYNSATGANNLLRIKDNKHWNKCKLSALHPTETKGFYYTFLPVKLVKSLCVVHLPSTSEKIEIRVLSQYYPQSKPELLNLVYQTIQQF